MRDLGIACYSPRQLQRAYNLGPLYARGYDGRGRTIVIVDPFGSPTIRRDLGVFDRAFGLPAPPSLRIAQPVGQVPRFSLKNAGMVDKAAETTLDVEWSHAIAPGASILLVETPVQETLSGGGFPQFMAAEDYVIRDRLGDVISQSFSLPEQNFPSRSALLRLRYAYTGACRHQVTVLAATNDFGAAGPTPTATGYLHPVVFWPASDPLVTGVRGHRAAPERGRRADLARHRLERQPQRAGRGTRRRYVIEVHQNATRVSTRVNRGPARAGRSAGFPHRDAAPPCPAWRAAVPLGRRRRRHRAARTPGR